MRLIKNLTSRTDYYVIDCSDEMQGACSTHFQCQDAYQSLQTGWITGDIQTCIHVSKRCDGTAQCGDTSDECGCPDSVSCPGTGTFLFWLSICFVLLNVGRITRPDNILSFEQKNTSSMLSLPERYLLRT